MKRIGIIDADLISTNKRNKGTHPNLACMKLSGFHKVKGDKVDLLLNYNTIDDYDQVYISKVFTDSIVPTVNEFFEVPYIERPYVKYGGTGFFLGNAEPLPDYIEHHYPDYNLYCKWVSQEEERGIKQARLKYYKNYSIGFTTRGCFRKCQFCVNQKYDKVFFHSHVKEFFNPDKKIISLWDDNIFGYSKWNEVFAELIDTGKNFEFKQGMDIRLLSKEKAKTISSCKYYGDYIFAFDNIDDKERIISQLKLWREYVNPKRKTKLYILCGFDKNGNYDETFWRQDIINTFERIKVLMEFGCVPYIMRFRKCNGPYRDVYQGIKRWCNYVPGYMKKSFRQYCVIQGEAGRNPEINSLRKMEKLHPDIVKRYFDLRREDIILDKDWL